MEKKAQRDPAQPGNTRRQAAVRRSRTLADATDPRVSAKRPAYPAYGMPAGSDEDYYGPEYSARDEQNYPVATPDGARPSRRGYRGLIDRISHGPRLQHAPRADWDEYARNGEDWSADPEDSDTLYTTGRTRAQSVARPLTLARVPRVERALAPMDMDSVPNLVAFRPPMPAQRKPVYTRAIETARRNPWTVSRTFLMVIVVVVTLFLSVTSVGEPSQPLMQFFNVQAAGASAQSITDLVQPLTQGTRKDEYDSIDQYNTYWGAACSAAVLAETLTAWGFKGVTIGKMIDQLGSYISPNGGLLSYAGFQRVASLYNMRSDFRENLTYKQMLYIVNTLHLPLIVNVRISYGFYYFFSGGHFMVMTAGDNQGVRLVDSSLYYVHYMPLSVFNSMFTGRTVLLVPNDYILSLPSI